MKTTGKPKPMKCHHCSYEWDYKGNAFYYATCPRCLRKIRIPFKSMKGGKDGKSNNK